MAQSISLTLEERNDNKALIFTDNSGTYHAVDNPTGWGTPNVNVTDIDGVTHTLFLKVSITDSTNTTTVYDPIDLYTEFGPFTTAADLVFTIDASMLISGTVALGTSDDELPDGIYDIIYILDEGLGTETSFTEDYLLDGVVRVSSYELLRELPVKYLTKNLNFNNYLNTSLASSYLRAMTSSAYTAKREELINQLNTLKRLLTNGSDYTWR